MDKKNKRELIDYIIVGGFTTLINFVIYWVFINQLFQSWLIANIFAWIGAVAFAFVMNRAYVFKSSQDSKREGIQFIGLRVITLVVESILLFLFIDSLAMPSMIAKLLVSVVTVVSNYGLCKFKIFNQGGVQNEKN